MSATAPGTYPASHAVNAVDAKADSAPIPNIAGVFSRLDKLETWAWGKPSSVTLYCSFCGKSQHEVRRLVASPTAFICDECVALCVDICAGPVKP